MRRGALPVGGEVKDRDHDKCQHGGDQDPEDQGYRETAAPGIQDLILKHEAFRGFVFGMYGARLAEVMELVEEVAFRKLDTRLAQILLQRGPVVEATHQKLADDLGSVREIVSRLLRSFEQRGWVKLERERVTVLDPKGLALQTRD
ncbi:MAG TPA: helix-turn-helix domain-containing protein [Burkholderiales bacterium]